MTSRGVALLQSGIKPCLSKVLRSQQDMECLKISLRGCARRAQLSLIKAQKRSQTSAMGLMVMIKEATQLKELKLQEELSILEMVIRTRINRQLLQTQSKTMLLKEGLSNGELTKQRALNHSQHTLKFQLPQPKSIIQLQKKYSFN